jgi:hypothetical protein
VDLLLIPNLYLLLQDNKCSHQCNHKVLELLQWDNLGLVLPNLKGHQASIQVVKYLEVAIKGKRGCLHIQECKWLHLGCHLTNLKAICPQ